MERQICGKKRHNALNCYHINNFAYQRTVPSPSLSAMQAQTLQSFQASRSSLPNDSWIVDTRAFHHITTDMQSLQNVTPYEGKDKIIVGNRECLPIKHIGTTQLQTMSHSLILRSVLHVSTIAVNLLSIKQLCKDN